MIAQIEDTNVQNEIVQLPTAQIDMDFVPMPNILGITTFTNHIGI